MRRTILLLSVVAILLASCGSDTDEGKDAEPTGAAEPSENASASPSTSEDVTPGGFAFSDLVGQWTGDLIEPGENATWATQILIEKDCDVGEPCGEMRIVSHDVGPTDMTQECGFSLIYEGYDPSLGAFTFLETDATGYCTGHSFLQALTPLQDGYTLGIQERWSTDWITYGVLRSPVTKGS